MGESDLAPSQEEAPRQTHIIYQNYSHQTLYSKVLLKLTRRRYEQLGAPESAVRKGHQAHEVRFVLR